MRISNDLIRIAATAGIVIGTLTGVSAEEKEPAPWETLSPAPQPPSLETLPPTADIPGHLRDMIGVWRGKWAGTLDSFIVVRNINKTHAQVHYSWGTNMLVKQAGYVDIDANIVGSKLKYTFQEGYRVSFEISRDGKIILGRYYSPDKVVEARFEKIDNLPVSKTNRSNCLDSVVNPKFGHMNRKQGCMLLE